MGDYDQFGNCFKAMHAMAIVGMWAIIILIIISLTGLAFETLNAIHGLIH